MDLKRIVDGKLLVFSTSSANVIKYGLKENTPSPAPSDNTMQTEWSPKVGPLMTAWSSEVSPEAPHPEYPRPQLVREEWSSLNGIWEFDLIDQ